MVAESRMECSIAESKFTFPWSGVEKQQSSSCQQQYVHKVGLTDSEKLGACYAVTIYHSKIIYTISLLPFVSLEANNRILGSCTKQHPHLKDFLICGRKQSYYPRILDKYPCFQLSHKAHLSLVRPQTQYLKWVVLMRI